MCMGDGAGHTQSLIFASTMLLAGVQTIIVGLLGDVISANRKILQDIQYHVRKMDYDKDSGRDEANYDEIAVAERLINRLNVVSDSDETQTIYIKNDSRQDDSQISDDIKND